MGQGLTAAIEKLIVDLKDSDARVRRVAADELGRANVVDDRILAALNDVVSTENNKSARDSAAHAYLIIAQRPAPASASGQVVESISGNLASAASPDEQIRLLRELV